MIVQPAAISPGTFPSFKVAVNIFLISISNSTTEPCFPHDVQSVYTRGNENIVHRQASSAFAKAVQQKSADLRLGEPRTCIVATPPFLVDADRCAGLQFQKYHKYEHCCSTRRHAMIFSFRRAKGKQCSEKGSNGINCNSCFLINSMDKE